MAEKSFNDQHKVEQWLTQRQSPLLIL